MRAEELLYRIIRTGADSQSGSVPASTYSAGYEEPIIYDLRSVTALTSMAAAATIQLVPETDTITGQGYNSAGRLSGSGITGEDVKNWLGFRDDGWYTTTGNGDMRWGSASANPEDQTLHLPGMPGTAGVYFGLKMIIENIQDSAGLSFSLNIFPAGTGALIRTPSGMKLGAELCKGTKNNDGNPWDVPADLTPEQLEDMKKKGNGKPYAVVGSAGEKTVTEPGLGCPWRGR